MQEGVGSVNDNFILSSQSFFKTIIVLKITPILKNKSTYEYAF